MAEDKTFINVLRSIQLYCLPPQQHFSNSDEPISAVPRHSADKAHQVQAWLPHIQTLVKGCQTSRSNPAPCYCYGTHPSIYLLCI